MECSHSPVGGHEAKKELSPEKLGHMFSIDHLHYCRAQSLDFGPHQVIATSAIAYILCGPITPQCRTRSRNSR